MISEACYNYNRSFVVSEACYKYNGEFVISKAFHDYAISSLYLRLVTT